MNGIITTTRGPSTATDVNKRLDERNKGTELFTECIDKINNTRVDNAKDLEVMMRIFNLREYSDNY